MTKKRVRSMPIYVWVRPDEMEVIQGRMAEAGISNLSAYIHSPCLPFRATPKTAQKNGVRVLTLPPFPWLL